MPAGGRDAVPRRRHLLSGVPICWRAATGSAARRSRASKLRP